jgi:uncharacterized protein
LRVVYMIVDAHVHLLPRAVREDRTPFCESDPAFGALYKSDKAKIASQDEIIRYMDLYSIDTAFVFGFPWEDPHMIRQNNDEVWSFHERHPQRVIPFAVMSTQGGEEALQEVERTLDLGFAGLGELAAYREGWGQTEFQAVSPCLELAEKRQVPVIIHVNEPVGHQYPGKIPVDFGRLLNMIEAHQDLDFVLAHFGGGIFVYALMPEIAAFLSRTYLDTAASPFLYDARIFEVACRIMGPDKVLFGSDYPLLALDRYLKEMDKADLDEPVRRAILGENALKLIRRTENGTR